MKRISFLLPFLIAVSSPAQAEKNDVCKRNSVSMAKNAEMSAQVTLFARSGNTGRSTGFNHNYRPQLNFSTVIEGVSCQGSEVTCEIHIPKPKETVEPGETTTVGVKCDNTFNTFSGKASFTLLEGGRVVGTGVLK
jgi:translation elongation factor EF-Tu-like GTPase